MNESTEQLPGGPGDIAIIGISCRMPGAMDARRFWGNLVQGRESIRFLAEHEIEVDRHLLADPRYVPAVGDLEGYDQFDAALFGIPERTAELMTPEHRLFLECAWEVMEDAGHDPQRFRGEMGVYAACNPQSIARYGNVPDWGAMMNEDIGAGTYEWCPDCVSSNVLYYLGLEGDAMTVVTLCAGFHGAVHMACQSLLLGQTDMAIAGGVMVRLPHLRGHIWLEGQILSKDGHCRPFDAQGTGSALSSGAAVLLLKPLDAALRDRDHVYAVIKGTALNNNGAKAMAYGTAHPERFGACVAAAQAAGGTPAETITLLEAFGVGMPLSDAIEVKAMSLAFQTKHRGYCSLGSVKGNIGHCGLASAGAATLKAVLALHHRQIPATLNLRTPNPALGMESTPFHLQPELTGWEPQCGIRRAGVNAIGASGFNAHMVLEEAPGRPQRPPFDGSPQLLTLSDRSEAALANQRQRLHAWLKAHPELRVDDVCFTLNLGRKAMEHRWAAVVRSRQELLEALAGTRGAASSEAGKLQSLAQAWEAGRAPDWEQLYAGTRCVRVSLPGRSFERKRFWHPHEVHPHTRSLT